MSLLEKLQQLDSTTNASIQIKIVGRGEELSKKLQQAEVFLHQLEETFGEADEIHVDQHRGVIHVQAGYNFLAALIQEDELFSEIVLEDA